jgi:hypothetical protein
MIYARFDKMYDSVRKLDTSTLTYVSMRLTDCVLAAKTTEAKRRLVGVIRQITIREALRPLQFWFPYAPLQVSKNIIPSRKPSLWNKLKNFWFKTS